MIVIMLILVSCNKAESDNTVRIWMYRYMGYYGDLDLKDIIENDIKDYAIENDIKVEFMKYSDEELSIEDYILKRNLALEHGNADIVIGDINSGIAKISNYVGDYTKLSNYKNVFDNYKGLYCIPIASLMRTIVVDNEVLNLYGIECNKYITLDQYYEIKQTMKERGAKFKYDWAEDSQLFNYYVNKNNIEMIKDDGKFTLDKKLVLKAVMEISEDIQEHYNVDMDIENREEQLYSTENYRGTIYDEASGRDFAKEGEFLYPLKFSTLTYEDDDIPFEDYTVVIRNDIEECMYTLPSLLINKNTKKDNTYKIADFLISDTFQEKIYNSTLAYSTIVDTHEVKEKIGYNDDWSYKNDSETTKKYNQELNNNDMKDIIDGVKKSYEIFKSVDAKKVFNTPRLHSEAIYQLINEEVYKIIDDPNYDETVFNKNADEFLINFNVKCN